MAYVQNGVAPRCDVWPAICYGNLCFTSLSFWSPALRTKSTVFRLLNTKSASFCRMAGILVFCVFEGLISGRVMMEARFEEGLSQSLLGSRSSIDFDENGRNVESRQISVKRNLQPSRKNARNHFWRFQEFGPKNSEISAPKFHFWASCF